MSLHPSEHPVFPERGALAARGRPVDMAERAQAVIAVTVHAWDVRPVQAKARRAPQAHAPRRIVQRLNAPPAFLLQGLCL